MTSKAPDRQGLISGLEYPQQVTKAHKRADINEKSGEDEGNLSHFSKTDVRYWTRSIFRKAYTVRGQPRYTPHLQLESAPRLCRFGSPARLTYARSRSILNVFSLTGNVAKAGNRRIEQTLMTPQSIGGILLADDLV